MRRELVTVGRGATDLLVKQQGQGTKGVVSVSEEGALEFEKELIDALVPSAPAASSTPSTATAFKSFAIFNTGGRSSAPSNGWLVPAAASSSAEKRIVESDAHIALRIESAAATAVDQVASLAPARRPAALN